MQRCFNSGNQSLVMLVSDTGRKITKFFFHCHTATEFAIIHYGIMELVMECRDHFGYGLNQ